MVFPQFLLQHANLLPMKTFLTLLFLPFALLIFSGCDGEIERSNLEKRRAEDQFFSSAAVASLKDFKNEAANFSTDYLQLFKDDPIAWQPWDNRSRRKQATAKPLFSCS